MNVFLCSKLEDFDLFMWSNNSKENKMYCFNKKC